MSIATHDDNQQMDVALAFALLSIGELKLLIPRHEISSLVSVDDIRLASNPKIINTLGSITFAETNWPVFALSSQLTPVHQITDNCRICIILHIDNQYIGLLCDQIQNIGKQQVQAMQPCMHTSTPPLSGLLIYENAIVCATSTKRLHAFLVD